MAEAFSFMIHPLFYQIILPFILVFAVIFAILERSEILGEGKKYVNILVAACISFIFIGVPSMVNLTLKIIPIVSVVIVVLLCLLLIFGFTGIEIRNNKSLKIALGIVLGVAMLIIILWSVGAFKFISKWSHSSGFASYIAFTAIFVGVIIAVAASGGKKEHSS